MELGVGLGVGAEVGAVVWVGAGVGVGGRVVVEVAVEVGVGDRAGVGDEVRVGRWRWRRAVDDFSIPRRASSRCPSRALHDDDDTPADEKRYDRT